MDLVFQYLWAGYFAAALYLRISNRGNLALVLGLAGFGVNNLRFALSNWGLIPFEALSEYQELFTLLNLASIGLLIGGILLLARQTPDGRGGRALLDAAGVNLSTLFIPRNDTNTYSSAEMLRDKACARLVDLARSSDIEVIEQKSNAHSPSVWFRLDYLLPEADPTLSLRANVNVTVERYDFHRFEHLFNITAQVGTETARVNGVIEFDDIVSKCIHRYIMEPGTKLRIPGRVRNFGWQFWRPKNKVKRLAQDWVSAGALAVAMLLFFIPIVGPVIAVGIFVALYFRNKKRRTYVLTSGKPQTDPRSLQWLDSWQATVAGLAASAQKLSESIMARVQRGAPQDLSIKVERVGYWSVDSRVIRDQVAVRYRRALGFIHVVPHGENLYVAWECHLNRAAWAEETLARGVDKVTGRNVHANRVVSGVQVLNEYDIADANFLAQWLHEAVKRELKLKMTEQQIDQEVDFTVQRESRKEVLDTGGAEKDKKGVRESRFKRVS
jgi:hypothetical protein